MAKILLLTNIYLIFSVILLVYAEDSINKENEPKKDIIEWNTKALIDYTLKNHGKDNYFICDPLNYITSDEKEVIYYRLESIYQKLNITTFFFVVDKISLEGLNINEYKKSIESDEEEDEIIYKKEKDKDNNETIINRTENGTVIKSEEEKQLEYRIYMKEIIKKLFNRKNYIGKESKCLVGIFTVEEVGKYLYVGKDYRDMINEDEIKTLLEGKEYLIEKKNLYLAVDNLFSNFLYRYSPSKLDKFNKFMGFLGEILGIGAIFVSYFLMNRKKEEPNNNNSSNKNDDKNKNKKKEDENKKEIKENNENKEKEKEKEKKD